MPIHKKIKVNEDECVNAIIDSNRSKLQLFVSEMKLKYDTVEVVNTEDTLTETIDHYPNGDICNYVKNGKIFRFSVREYPTLISSNKNFYTRELLPPDFRDK